MSNVALVNSPKPQLYKSTISLTLLSTFKALVIGAFARRLVLPGLRYAEQPGRAAPQPPRALTRHHQAYVF
ncbi:hypothetical protein JYU34_022324 [Plutella xylostella]|uniref:Uncharacterized protein n=1 Tax=Plutella xylostella TaxID=51655 RepID=A0ABQ7PQQ7_PLUXY|nr:hypothetical protein JYU34_022324 [Plutella xylostella]